MTEIQCRFCSGSGKVTMITGQMHWGSFDEVATRVMGAAFDMACKSLPYPCHGAAPEIIAKHILAATAVGERDPAKLSDKALRDVSIAEMSMPIVGVGRDPPTRTYA